MKYALVTGSTRGIGNAIAEALEGRGYTVIRNGRTKSDGAKPFIQADLSTEAGAEKLIKELKRYTDRLDCVVFNSGTTSRKAFRDISYQDLQMVPS